MSIRRREVLAFLGAGIALCASCRAQSQDPARKVAIYGGVGDKKKFFSDFSAALAKHGWREGSAMTLRHFERSVRGSGTLAERQAAALVEVLAWKPDVIVTGNTLDAQALQRATRTVPVVFAWVDDPVRSGLVQSLRRPGGNLTGAMNSEAALAMKRLEVARQLFPDARRLAVVFSESNDAPFEVLMKELQDEARKLGVELARVRLKAEGDVSEMIAAIEAVQPRAVIMVGNLSFGKGTVEGIERAMSDYVKRSRVPFVSNDVESVAAGELIGVAEPREEMLRRTSGLAARVLAGARPSELPVDQAMRLEVWINVSSAKKLGIAVPPALAARADRIIQ